MVVLDDAPGTLLAVARDVPLSPVFAGASDGVEMTWADYRTTWRNAERDDSCASVGWVCWHIIVAGLVVAVVMEAIR